jgi:hypothetical protein
MLATNNPRFGPAHLALARRRGLRFTNEFNHLMMETYHGPRAGNRSRLYREFAEFYTTERCRWAPTNPRRAFNLAFGSISSQFRDQLTMEQILAVMFETLGYRGAPRPGLFQTFEPAKYKGMRPLEEHFLSLFARKLKGKLTSLLRRTTDHGRKGDRTKFRPNPALGLLRQEVRPASEQDKLDSLLAILAVLDAREREVVHLLYWRDLSARKAGEWLGMNHKTVGRVHESALAKLRRHYGLEENSAA